METQYVTCPACDRSVRSHLINRHLDEGCSEWAATSPTITSSQSSSSYHNMSIKPVQPTSSKLAPIFTAGPLKSEKSSSLVHSSQARTQLTNPTPRKRLNKNESSDLPIKRHKTANSRSNVLLSESLRPRLFSEFVGQPHLTEPGSLLSTIFEAKATWSIILWGPPGCGKTSLAKLFADLADTVFKELSATASGINEVKAIVEDAKKISSLTGKRTILFLDEIHRFNRAQQDIFLPYIEQGLIQLIGATTENPSFRLTGALLSRCRVLRLEPLNNENILEILRRALQKLRQPEESAAEQDVKLDGAPCHITSRILSRIVSMANGDARTALSLLEVAYHSPTTSSEEQITDALKQSLVTSYDRTGEDHYDMISALHKSVRGSDGSAAMYWLARMLTAGEDPIFITRRMVVCASEDIGLADNHALPLAMATLQACQVIGMPECRINLAHLVAYLSEAPKSTRSYEAYKRAEQAAKQTTHLPVPMQIRNAPTLLMEEMGYGKGYRYNPDYCHPVHNQYLPEELSDNKFLLKGDDTSGKTWDEEVLQEWETKDNKGLEWEGRTKRPISHLE